MTVVWTTGYAFCHRQILSFFYLFFPSREAIRAIACPTLILAWSGDPGHPTTTAEQLDDLIADSRLHVASTAEELDTWTDRIIEFIQTASTTASTTGDGDLEQ